MAGTVFLFDGIQILTGKVEGLRLELRSADDAVLDALKARDLDQWTAAKCRQLELREQIRKAQRDLHTLNRAAQIRLQG